MFRAFDAENDAWYAASAVVASSKVTSKKRKRGASGNENSGRKGNNGMSDYEKQRMQRIAENQKMLAEIGVESFSKVSSSIMASEFAARARQTPKVPALKSGGGRQRVALHQRLLPAIVEAPQGTPR